MDFRVSVVIGFPFDPEDFVQTEEEEIWVGCDEHDDNEEGENFCWVCGAELYQTERSASSRLKDHEIKDSVLESYEGGYDFSEMALDRQEELIPGDLRLYAARGGGEKGDPIVGCRIARENLNWGLVDVEVDIESSLITPGLIDLSKRVDRRDDINLHVLGEVS